MPKNAHLEAAVTPAAQLAGFIAKLDPQVARLLRAARAALRRRFPTAIEQVYDNYNFLVVGFCTSERQADCMVSLAANAKGIILSFYWGATLPDPTGILQGSGSQNRFLRLKSAAMLAEPAVEALLAAAAAQAKSPLPATGRGYLTIKSVSARQRPRRPAE